MTFPTPSPRADLDAAAAQLLDPYLFAFGEWLALGVLLAVTAIVVAHIWDRSHDVAS